MRVVRRRSAGRGRRALAALLLSGLAFVASACGGEDEAPGAGGGAGAAGGVSDAGEAASDAGDASADDASDGAPDLGVDEDAHADDADASLDAPPDGPGDAPTDPPEEVDAAATWPSTPPQLLSLTGLYADIATKQLAPGVSLFAPRYVLWSDGADKLRWVWLPPGTKIDTTDMDHWRFPVGATFYKEFKYGGLRVETRVIRRFGPGKDDWWYATYAWNDAETEGTYAPLGVPDARGTTHDIPAQSQCVGCHGYLVERALGFGAIQLSHTNAGETMTTLSNAGLLTVANSAGYPLPGNALTQEAVGYLHANCGNCHNKTGILQFLNYPYDLRVEVDQTSNVADLSVYKTAVGVPVDGFVHAGITKRVEPKNPDASAVVYRMSTRGSADQMPPIDTELTDPVGIQRVRDWISAMP